MQGKMENKMIDYFEGQLSESEITAFQNELKQSDKWDQMYAEYELIYRDFDSLVPHRPSPSSATKFHDFLEKEIAQQTRMETLDQSVADNSGQLKLNTKLLIAIVGLLILIFGLLVGLNIGKNTSNQELDIPMQNSMMAMQNELKQEEMMNLLEEKSTSVRIKAVNMTQDFQEPDESVMKALIKTMNNDRSANVRLAAINALARNANIDYVKTAFINALEIQTDPSIQISLINVISNLQSPDAIQSFDRLIEDEKTLKFVKDEAYFGKIKLETY